MKKIIFGIAALVVAGLAYVNHTHKVSAYRERIDHLNNVIEDRDSDIDLLRYEIELREDEISYLGHSLDSCRNGISR